MDDQALKEKLRKILKRMGKLKCSKEVCFVTSFNRTVVVVVVVIFRNVVEVEVVVRGIVVVICVVVAVLLLFTSWLFPLFPGMQWQLH